MSSEQASLKAEMRKKNAELLKSFTFDSLMIKSGKLAEKFQDFVTENQVLFANKFIVSFYPFDEEPQIQIEKETQDEPFRVAYVRIEDWKNRKMDARVARRDLPGLWEEFEVSSSNRIYQPKATQELCTSEEIGVILVPGLAFSRDGYRLGRGAGFYDRFLARFPHALRVGVTFDDLVYSEVPVDPWDERLDLILTDEAFYSTRSYGEWKIQAKITDRSPS